MRNLSFTEYEIPSVWAQSRSVVSYNVTSLILLAFYFAFLRSNSSWSTLSADSANFFPMTQDILISDVDIISMFIFFEASALNIRAAMPAWLLIPIPTIDIFAIFSSFITSPAPISLATLLATFIVLARSSVGTVKDTSVVPVRPTFWTIMSITILFAPNSLNIMAAIPGLSGTSQIVTFASSFCNANQLTSIFSMDFASLQIIVPSALEKLVRTCMGIS